MKTIIKVVEHIRKLLTAKPDAPLVISCLYAVDAIAQTMCMGEESVLTSVVPVCINLVREGNCTSLALTTLYTLT